MKKEVKTGCVTEGGIQAHGPCQINVMGAHIDDERVDFIVRPDFFSDLLSGRAEPDNDDQVSLLSLSHLRGRIVSCGRRANQAMNFMPQWNSNLYQHGSGKECQQGRRNDKSHSLFVDQSPLVGDAANHDTKLSHLGEDDTAGNCLSNGQTEHQRNQRDDYAFSHENSESRREHTDRVLCDPDGVTQHPYRSKEQGNENDLEATDVGSDLGGKRRLGEHHSGKERTQCRRELQCVS